MTTILAQPFWENGASVFWVIIAVGVAIAMIANAIRGKD